MSTRKKQTLVLEIASILALVFFFSSCKKEENMSMCTSSDNTELIRLQKEIKKINIEFSDRNPQLRGFFSKLWDRISGICSADAGGAAYAYDTTMDEGFTLNRGWKIIAGAVRGSWEEAWNPSETRSMENNLITINHSSNSNLQTVLSKRYLLDISIDNPYHKYGLTHNEVFYAYAKRVKNAKDLSKSDALTILIEETRNKYEKNFGISLSDEQFRNFKDEFISEDYTPYRRAIFEDHYSASNESINLIKYCPSISVEEANLKTTFIENISRCPDTETIIAYSNEINNLVINSNLSDTSKERISLYLSIATHSAILWNVI